MLHSQVRRVPSQVVRLAEPTPSVRQTDIQETKNKASVSINNYGQEDQTTLKSMSYSALKKVLKLSPDNKSILSMIKFIHLNKNQPENRNIKKALPVPTVRLFMFSSTADGLYTGPIP